MSAQPEILEHGSGTPPHRRLWVACALLALEGGALLVPAGPADPPGDPGTYDVVRAPADHWTGRVLVHGRALPVALPRCAPVSVCQGVPDATLEPHPHGLGGGVG